MTNTQSKENETLQAPPDFLPCPPEPLLPPDEKFDVPPYKGDLNDLTERRNTKLYNLWTIWSDLRKNEELIKLLAVETKDTKELQFLKGMLTIVMDRMGKVLSDTNIVEELCCKGETSPTPTAST